jgi:aminomethyltransferase
MTAPLRLPPLDQRHAALGAKVAAFGGWRMPLEYAGGGVIAEHTAVRTAVGVFDVSHLGKATISTRSRLGRRSTRCAATRRPAG